MNENRFTHEVVKPSLIVTCYNKPEILKFVLNTVLEQRVPPKEIIVADDGSGEANFLVTRELRAKTSIPLIHVWQPDEGFRLNRSRNNALSLASGNYVIMIDGDCFVGPRFVEDHIVAARRGKFVVGSRVHIGAKRKEKILASGRARVGFFSSDMTNRQHALRSRFLSRIASVDDAPRVPTKPVIGANLAFWLDDAKRVNGFNEIFVGYGDDDVEFCNRLNRADVGRYKIRYLATAFHLHHDDRNAIPRENFEVRLANSVEADKIRVKNELGLTRALNDMSLRIEK